MPHDFRSPGKGAGHAPATPIGFHELRQACEISTLREDLERMVQETGTLRDSVEEAVEQVRARFAALTAEEMADPVKMAPLLQFAVSTLLDIREQARRLNTQTGPLSDDDRPSWMAAAEAPRLRPTVVKAAPPDAPSVKTPAPVEPVAPPPPPVQRMDPPPPEPPSPFAPAAPAAYPAPPPAPRRPDPAPPPAASWLSSPSAPPAPSRGAAPRTGSTTGANKGIDWLGPAGR
ncbi:hypothetical protein [Azospirillum soli]|uniref:hypothetical protein n=1 Tax=Azospirillum soli TaxID=1304799 RepID=UPI001FEB8EE1|nr:hypothetical protein [Azospirillum soli]MBP2312333.1 outer membrane biosynthesis protein TonB [Azospirillum soli]